MIRVIGVRRDGRPGSQQVTEQFLVDWGSYMSSRNDVVYVKLDVAGARGLPRALLRGRLGGVEVADQLAVIRYDIPSQSSYCRRKLLLGTPYPLNVATSFVS
jgi:hypothetical protein